MSGNNLEVLALPERDEFISSVSRKTYYKSGVRNVHKIAVDKSNRSIFGVEDEDQDSVSGFVSFDRARIIRMAVRKQLTKKNRQMLVVTMSVMFDNFRCGLISETGEDITHPMFVDERYKAYRNLPHRISAQQWASVDSASEIVSFANALRNTGTFRIDQNPSNPQNSQRETEDLFQVRPITPIDPKNPTAYGQVLDGLEVSVNHDYVNGFRSFYEGVTEQQQRWESAASSPEEVRESRLQALMQNLHFVGGVYHDEKARRHWARSTDVGVITMEGKDFPLYPINGRELDEQSIISALQQESKTLSTGNPLTLAEPDLDSLIQKEVEKF